MLRRGGPWSDRQKRGKAMVEQTKRREQIWRAEQRPLIEAIVFGANGRNNRRKEGWEKDSWTAKRRIKKEEEKWCLILWLWVCAFWESLKAKEEEDSENVQFCGTSYGTLSLYILAHFHLVLQHSQNVFPFLFNTILIM